MGTPEFAVASLDALLQAGCQVIAVVTAPDKPAGRGLKLQESAVKKFAVENNIPVLQPPKLKDPAFIETIRSLKADLQVVVAFRMLPEVIWNMPSMGTINVHASLLPQYRGAAPINWAIINGEQETGVTTFKLQHEIDTGDILLQQRVPIGASTTAGELHDQLKTTGAAVLVETIKGVADGSVRERPQLSLIESLAFVPKHAGKIFTETCQINWEQKTEEIYNLIRGLSPYPGAFTYLQNKLIKIFIAEKEITAHSETPGAWTTDHKNFLKFASSDGYIVIKELQPEGKKRMAIEDFLRGFRAS